MGFMAKLPKVTDTHITVSTFCQPLDLSAAIQAAGYVAIFTWLFLEGFDIVHRTRHPFPKGTHDGAVQKKES
jgi:hypothetical protein